MKQHTIEGAQPLLTPLEHWKNDKGAHTNLLPGHIFNEKVKHEDFQEQTSIPLNNHMKTKGMNSHYTIVHHHT